MTSTNEEQSISLLESQSVGGAVSERGLTFQEAVLLEHIPRWMAEEGFTAFIRESLSDIEAMFFLPGVGFQKEFIEAKDHAVTPAEFKQELKRFRQLEAASPSTFRWFTLACRGLSDALEPLSNGLRNLRDPFPFYSGETVVQNTSYADFEMKVLNLNLGFTQEDAQFLFDKVVIKPEYGHAIPGEALFRQGVTEYLTIYNDLPQSQLTSVFDSVCRLVRHRLRIPTTRREVENAMRSAMLLHFQPPISSVIVWTHSEPDVQGAGLQLHLHKFFGGNERQYPPTSEWESGLIRPLQETRQWIEQNRLTRRIRLEGSRRLSTAIAIGATLPAVSGFVIELNHRGTIWATDDYSTDGAEYNLAIELPKTVGNELIVIFGVLKDIRDEVAKALPALQLQDTPLLTIHHDKPVVSSANANSLVSHVKAEMHQALVATKAQRIHLFYAGPSHVALFLGHRLNATAPIQCYEWVGPETYARTCFLG